MSSSTQVLWRDTWTKRVSSQETLLSVVPREPTAVGWLFKEAVTWEQFRKVLKRAISRELS